MKTLPILLLYLLQVCLIHSANASTKNNLSTHSQKLLNNDFKWQQPAQYANDMAEMDQENQTIVQTKQQSVEDYSANSRRLKKNGGSKNTHSSQTGPVGSSNNNNSSDSDNSTTIIIVVVCIIGGGGTIILIYCIIKHYCSNGSTGENNQRLSTNDWNIVKSENDSPLGHRNINLPGIRGSTSSKVKKTAIFVGEPACGKSSLLNNLFKVNQAVGSGECTQKIQKISWQGSFQILDSKFIKNDTLGQDDADWQQYLKYNYVFVVYGNSLVNVSKFVRYMIENKRDGLYFVRSKCDTFKNKGHYMGLEGELAKDREKLKQWGLNEATLYCTSIFSGDYDNQKLKNVFK